MKKLILLFMGFWCAISTAQNSEKTLLWKISGKDLKQPSYLFGTIHITCDASLSEKVKKALNATQQLCLELDMDDTNMQTEMMKSMMMKNGVTLESLASVEDFKIVDAFLTKNLGFSAKMLNTVKPFMVSAMLYPKMMNCEMQSVEAELIKVAQAQKEETIGLETVSEQLAVFDAIPYQDQMNELIKTAKSDLTRDIKELNDMLAIYQSEDIKAMVELTKNSDNVLTSKFDDELLNNRNQNWIARIHQIALQKSTFFGVGAAHLGGEKGVIHLLRKNGFTVEPVH